MNILITNDDGIDSPGIFALVNKLEELGKVTVIAPDRQQSAVGHALTVLNPLRVSPFYRNGKIFGYAVNGTPSDCVKLAISSLLDEKPDLVVSGINHGKNTSVNILYSGTVSAATEGMLLGIPSLAISLASYSYGSDMSVAAEYSLNLAKSILQIKLPEGTLINVNIPDLPLEKIKGIKITKQSKSIWKDSYDKRTDPFGRDYYWFAGEYETFVRDPDCDDVAIEEGYVSVTPIHFNFTNREFIDKLKFLESK